MNGLEKIQKALLESDLDAIFIESVSNLRYATGFYADAGGAFITPNSGHFFTDFRYIEDAGRLPGYTVSMSSRENKTVDIINRLIERESVSTLGLEEREISFGRHQFLSERLNAKLSCGSELLSKVRMVKADYEIEAMQAAQNYAERAFERILPYIKEGAVESDLNARLTYYLHLECRETLPFEPILVSGANTSLPHGKSGEKTVAYGDFVTLDFGASCRGYGSDMTRTVAVGAVSAEMKRVYNTVLSAQLAALSLARAGVPHSEMDQAAREIVDKAGYSGRFGHSLSHGIGVQVHEPLPCNETGLLLRGGAISVEPGIYLPGEMGVRIEDVIVLTEKGYINLAGTSKELIII